MRTFALFFGFLVFALFVVSPITYPIIALFGLNVEHDGWTEIWAKLFALAIFFPFIRWLGLGGLRDLGWSKDVAHPVRMILFGMVEGFLVVAPIGVLLLLTDFRVIAEDFEPLKDISKALIAGLVGGLLIGMVEETFFRGAAWKHAQRKHGILHALIATCLFYASVHFIQVQALPEATPWAWYNGTLEVFNGLADYFHYFSLSSFTTLFVAGLLLTTIRQRDGDLYRVIGIHAGSVMVIRQLRSNTQVDHDHELSWLAGSYDYVTGWPATLWLSCVLALVIWKAGGFKKLYGH
ncbi:MAG: type II CAAX prenyl endopeptidase Rce1 family protein [Gammaproteobacteria bacterium]